MSQPITLTLARRAPRLTCSLAALALVVLLVLPFLALLPADNPLAISTYTLTLLGKILCYAVVAVALDLVWGYAGLLSLGHGLFFALGGYAMGMYLMRQASGDGLPAFMSFLSWTELPWFWAGTQHFAWALCLIILVPGLLALVFGYFALPVAFFMTALVGMLLERTIIRHLYGRPLETLLATWGISLMLIQLVRVLFGTQNLEVANPSWLSGGWNVLPNLVLPYNRIAVILFVIGVLALTWLLLNKTRLGMNVRAVTQNRRMADCCGVPTGRVDMLAFGLGSGIAGLGGVALSQLGNVGPDLGQGYIIDSFLVVVTGGVGQLAGTVVAALGLGVLNKVLEPQIGAVLGKIAILVLIVLFIQKRPQGLFAFKGRVID